LVGVARDVQFFFCAVLNDVDPKWNWSEEIASSDFFSLLKTEFLWVTSNSFSHRSEVNRTPQCESDWTFALQLWFRLHLVAALGLETGRQNKEPINDSSWCDQVFMLLPPSTRHTRVIVCRFATPICLKTSVSFMAFPCQVYICCFQGTLVLFSPLSSSNRGEFRTDRSLHREFSIRSHSRW
jgi:hypothetical protein